MRVNEEVPECVSSCGKRSQYLYTNHAFREKLEKPILKSKNPDAVSQLRRLVQPFLLRRLKKDVLKELPPKEEYVRKISLSEDKQKLYGAQRISHYLLENGIRRADGSMIPNTTIVRMIKNKLYTGVISNGNAESEIIPELQIVDEATFQRAQELMEKRTTHHADTPLNLRGSSLLVGNIFCGHCKNRLTLTTSGKKYIRKDGTVRNQVKSRYQCHFKARHPDLCDGQSGYGVIKLDEIVDALVRYQLSRIRVSAKDSLIAEQHEKAAALARSRYKMSAMRLEEKQKELSDYEAETINVIRGKSRLNVDLLNSLVAKCKEEIAELSQEVDAQKADMEHQLESAAQEQAEFEKLESWADLYDNCTFEAKKMIVSQLIKAVYVYRDYRLEVEFRVSFDDFRRLCVGCEPNGGRIATVESV